MCTCGCICVLDNPIQDKVRKYFKSKTNDYKEETVEKSQGILHLTITLSVCISYAVETDTVRGLNITVLRINAELRADCVS